MKKGKGKTKAPSKPKASEKTSDLPREGTRAAYRNKHCKDM